MTQGHDDELKKMEELLKKQKIRKVPPAALSNFSREVMDRVQKESPGFPGPTVVLSLILVGVLAGALAVVLVKNPPASTATSPSRTQEISRPAPAAPRPVPAKLTVEEEIRLLEEFDEDGRYLSFLQEFEEESDMLSQEIELFSALGAPLRSP